jgi:hypothetical protein
MAAATSSAKNSSHQRPFLVGAQHAEPGKHTWLPARHPPRPHGRLMWTAATCRGWRAAKRTVILSGVSRVFAFARSAGTQDRAPGSTVSRARDIRRRTSLRSPMPARTHKASRLSRRGTACCARQTYLPTRWLPASSHGRLLRSAAARRGWREAKRTVILSGVSRVFASA